MIPTLEQTAAVVLAGGFGTRVKHLLPDIPKPMALVAGKPFLEWVVQYLASEGIPTAVLSTGYLGHIIERHFAVSRVEGIRVICRRETRPLGTAGGFLHAVEASGRLCKGWFVLNGDSLIFPNLQELAQTLFTSKASGLIAACRVPDTSRYGSLNVSLEGGLVGFNEKRPGEGIISAGVYLFKSELLPHFPKTLPLSFEAEVFPDLIQKGVLIKVVEVDTPFLDIGTEETLAQASEFIQQNRERFHVG